MYPFLELQAFNASIRLSNSISPLGHFFHLFGAGALLPKTDSWSLFTDYVFPKERPKSRDRHYDENYGVENVLILVLNKYHKVRSVAVYTGALNYENENQAAEVTSAV